MVFKYLLLNFIWIMSYIIIRKEKTRRKAERNSIGPQLISPDNFHISVYGIIIL